MTPVAAIRPGSPRAWMLAARIPTLAAAVVPVGVGAACALRTGVVRWDAVVAALLGAAWIQVGTNLANDVFDFERGADDAQRLGPPRAAQTGVLSPRALRGGTAVAFGVAALFGVYLTLVAGLPVIAIGTLSIAAGIAYTAGPFPLAYHGLGELFVLVFFGGVAVCGTAWVAVGHVPALAWSAAIPVGASAAMLLVVNNVRDAETDRAAAKRTLVVRFGRRFGELEYVGFAALLYAVPFAWVAAGILDLRGLLPLVSLPRAWRLATALRAGTGRELNDVLRATAGLMLLHGALLAVAIAMAGR
jgi:1,4-dihydroxy-2-naphthoate octaprenyltransferase